jgi:hypothetical protein
MIIVKAPERVELNFLNTDSVFLAGSIEMGGAPDWQTEVTRLLEETGLVSHVFNPRRNDWDSSWLQRIDNPQFYEQVSWELDHLEQADFVFFYFAPGTQSPISLLELGLFADRANVTVVCPDGYWRKGNIDIVCQRHRIPVFKTLGEGVKNIIAEINFFQ